MHNSILMRSGMIMKYSRMDDKSQELLIDASRESMFVDDAF